MFGALSRWLGLPPPGLVGAAGRAAGIVSWFDILPAAAGVCAVALAVRLMDDFLDYRFDRSEGLVTSASVLREATFPYALAALATGALLAPTLAGTLFMGAYAVGMGSDLIRPLPLGLRGYQEALLALAIAIVGAGCTCAAWAFAALLAVQACDDIVDRVRDAHTGNRNLCHRFGTGEVLLGGVLALTISISLSPLLSLLVLLAVVGVQWLVQRRCEGMV